MDILPAHYRTIDRISNKTTMGDDIGRVSPVALAGITVVREGAWVAKKVAKADFVGATRDKKGSPAVAQGTLREESIV